MTVTVTSALAGPATARYSNVYGALVDLGVLSGLGAQDVTGSGDPVAPILNASEFYAPLTHSLILTRGTGSATFTRATKAWEFGYSAAANSGDSQILMEIASGTPRFGGARYDAGTWYNTYADGSAIPASTLLGNHAEGARTNSLLWARDLTKVAWLGLISGSELVANGEFGADASGWTTYAGASVAAVAGVLVLTSAGPGARTDTPITTVVGKRYIGTVTATAKDGGISSIRVGTSNNGGDQNLANTALTVGTPFTFSFVATGTTTYICLLTSQTSGTASFDNVSVKEAAIQVTTCTGIDNTADSASTLTAGAADATILQTLSLAAAARSFSAYVKRRTGSGNIYITRDGGTSWTDVTSQINSSTWTRVKIENTSVLNPSCGFKIATSGDAIDVDVCQDEAGSEAWSPIITTTAAVTRNADAETFPTASNWSDTAGWALATVQGESWANATGTAIGNGTNGLKLSASNSGVVAYDGTNTVNGPAGSPSGAEKLAMTWGSGALQAASGGVTGSAGSYDGAWGLATIGIGTSQGNVYIKDVYIGQSALTPAQIAQVTA